MVHPQEPNAGARPAGVLQGSQEYCPGVQAIAAPRHVMAYTQRSWAPVVSLRLIYEFEPFLAKRSTPEFQLITVARSDLVAMKAAVSRRAQALEADFSALMGSSWPQGSFEGLFTAVYQYEIRGGWTVQPNFQYVLHPGGGATDPLGANPGRLLRNAMVLAYVLP